MMDKIDGGVLLGAALCILTVSFAAYIAAETYCMVSGVCK